MVSKIVVGPQILGSEPKKWLQQQMTSNKHLPGFTGIDRVAFNPQITINQPSLTTILSVISPYHLVSSTTTALVNHS